MSAFTFLVSVETERDSGMNASRDEQQEAIAEALQEAAENCTIDSIGPRGDSSYSVIETEVQELDKKELKAVNADYEASVHAEMPGDVKLRQELKGVRKELEGALREIDRLNGRLEEKNAEAASKRTRIWIGERFDADDAGKTFLPDGQYDDVNFLVDHLDDEVFEKQVILRVGLERNSRGKTILKVHSGGHGALMAFNASSNVLRIAATEYF